MPANARNSITNEARFDSLPDVQTGTAQVLANSGTIPCTSDLVRINPGAAVTGIIIQSGIFDGQELVVVNIAAAANTATMAAAATSHVADGTGDAIVGLAARAYVWSAQDSLWYVEK